MDYGHLTVPQSRGAMKIRAPHTQPLVQPIYQSATFVLDERSYKDIAENDGIGEVWYSRLRNPTVDATGDVVATLEGADDALITSSGMGAISSLVLSLCKAGDRIVASRELYGDTHDLFTHWLPRLGMEVELVPVDDLSRWEQALRTPTTLVYGETLSNPQLRLLDIPAVGALAKAAGATFAVDNTFASPALVRPLELGADVVVASATKFLNGHSDVVAGAIAGSKTVVDGCRRVVMAFGSCLDPHAAFLLLRGLKTFTIRLDRQMANAAALAAILETSPDVERVIYPGLASYAQADLAARLLTRRHGAMISFVVTGGDERAGAVMRTLATAVEATSLGGVETLISAPYNSSHFMLSPDERTALGIEPGMLRLSVGTEEIDVLAADFASALASTSA
jgi:cystathionine beta-lyase/cystathionine gamma-synthase